jgi:NAD-dependent DNA ligase
MCEVIAARNGSGVTEKTDFLIAGEKSGSKLKKESLGVRDFGGGV